MLTEGRLTEFETFGFIVLRGMLEADEINEMDSEFDIGLAAADVHRDVLWQSLDQ